MLLQNKVALITGANQGLGYEIARQYAASGASLVICARNTSLLEQARKTLAKGLNAGQRIVSLGADVSSKADVEKIVATALTEFGRIDVLVNNAGIYGPKGPIDEIDWPEWVKAIEINLYGSILMTRGVLPSMKKAGSGKIVQLSGGGATNPLPCISAYAVSKAGIIRFVETVAEEVRQYNVHVNAIAPGALNTKMLDEVLEAGPEKVGRAFYERSVKQKERGGAPLERGAALAVYLGSSLSDGITGKLISAMWDPWESLDEHRAELDGTDVYTLRRIVPRDRGMTWGNDA